MTYLFHRAHRISWYIKMEAFSTCVNDCVQRRVVVCGSGLKVHAFGLECHVLLLKVFVNIKDIKPEMKGKIKVVF